MKMWLKRLGLFFLVLILIAILSGLIYEQIARNNAQRIVDEDSGEFVKIGERKIHYYKMGKGRPTVVFESGLGDDHSAWKLVQEMVASYATTVSYDRAGLWASNPRTTPYSWKAISDDLYQLLQKEGFEEPYILVGHSFAGITLRPFVAAHPGKIQGIVLVDASHPEQKTRKWNGVGFTEDTGPPDWLLKMLNSTSILRLISGDQFMYLGIKSGAMFEEVKLIQDSLASPVLDVSFGNIPLVVITGDSETRFDRSSGDKELGIAQRNLWHELQAEIAQLSTDSKQVMALKSGHMVNQQEPELIAEEIIRLIKAKEVKTDSISIGG